MAPILLYLGSIGPEPSPAIAFLEDMCNVVLLQRVVLLGAEGSCFWHLGNAIAQYPLDSLQGELMLLLQVSLQVSASGKWFNLLPISTKFRTSAKLRRCLLDN